jgi:hypothetical protein
MATQMNSSFTGIEWIQMRCNANHININKAFLDIERGMPYGEAVGSPLSVPNNKQCEEIDFAINTDTVQKLISLERNKTKRTPISTTNDIVIFLMLAGLVFYLLIFIYMVS